MSSLQSVVSMYNSDPTRKGKRALSGGQPTKDFLRLNRRYIKEGRATYYADQTKVFKPDTGKFVNRLTKTGRVQKKFKADKLVGSVVKQKSLGKTIKFSANDERLNHNELLYKILKDNPSVRGNYRIVITQNGQIIQDSNVNIPDNISKWWRNEARKIFQVNSQVMIWNNNTGNTSFIFTKEKQLAPAYITQTFADNTVKTCFFNPIIRYCQDKIESCETKKTEKKYQATLNKITGKETKKGFKDGYIQKYPNGVPQEAIRDLINDLNIGVDIFQPCDENPFLTFRPVKGDPRKVFKYINTRLNHVESMPQHKSNFWGKVYCDDYDCEVRTRAELNKMKNQFIKDKKPFIYGKDIYGITSIKTESEVFRIDDSYNDITNEFIMENKMYQYRIDRKQFPHLVGFLQLGTHFNGTRDFEPLDNENTDWTDKGHIDMKAAYVNYDKSKYYNGFAMNFNDFRPMDNYEQRGFYLIKNINTDNVASHVLKYMNKLSWFHNNNVYTQAELRCFADLGYKFEVVYGATSITGVDINIRDWKTPDPNPDNKLGAMVETKTKLGNDDEIPLYCKYIGSCARVSDKSNFYIHCTKEFARTLADDRRNVFYNEVEGCARVQMDNLKHNTLTHFAAQITAFQRIIMLEQLLKIPYEDVYRVCVDGIYLKKKGINYELVEPFRIKEKKGDMTWRNFECEHYLSNIEIDLEDGLSSAYQTIDMSVSKHYYKNTVLIKGAGGTGKTYGLKTDKGLINCLYASPSWLLASQMDNEEWTKTVHHRLEDDNKITRGIYNYGNIIVDECSMITEKQKLRMMNEANERGVRIFFLGDLDCQLPPVEGEMMSELNFKEIIEKKYVYRFIKDDKLHNLAKWVRGNMWKWPNVLMTQLKQKVKVITEEQLKEMYQPKDAIIAHSNKTCNFYTEMFNDMEKYKILECKNVDGIDKYNGEITLTKPQKIKNELRHGFTIHSYQGAEVPIGSKLFIDGSLNSTRLIYTAISRAKSIDQIYIIGNAVADYNEEEEIIIECSIPNLILH
jgi:hypothetical protein